MMYIQQTAVMLVIETQALHKHAAAFPLTLDDLDTSPKCYRFSISPRTSCNEWNPSIFLTVFLARRITDSRLLLYAMWSHLSATEQQVHDVHRCRREGFGVSGDDSCVLSVVQISFSESARLLSAMSLAMHLASGRPKTWPLVPTAAVHSLPVLLAPATSTNNTIVIRAAHTCSQQHRQWSSSDD